MRLAYLRSTAGPIEFDGDVGLFSGTVAGMRDVVHFAGRTADELAQAFRDSVDDDLAWCTQRGVPPERPAGPTLARAAWLHP